MIAHWINKNIKNELARPCERNKEEFVFACQRNKTKIIYI